MLALLWSGFHLYGVYTEVGLDGLLAPLKGQPPNSVVHLKPQAVYRIKKKQDLLGVRVTRITSHQQPEEFLVLEGVPVPLIDSVYGKRTDLGWATLMANQFLKLRANDETRTPITVEIQHFRSKQHREMTVQHQKLPYWEFEVQFKLSNEPASRTYDVGVLRANVPVPASTDIQSLDPGSKPANDVHADILVVAYAQSEVYTPTLLPEVFSLLNFTTASH